jgi:hypothetical protein
MEDVPVTKYNYPTYLRQMAISRGISARFVQECNGQECDGEAVWW